MTGLQDSWGVRAEEEKNPSEPKPSSKPGGLDQSMCTEHLLHLLTLLNLSEGDKDIER